MVCLEGKREVDGMRSSGQLELVVDRGHKDRYVGCGRAGWRDPRLGSGIRVVDVRPPLIRKERTKAGGQAKPKQLSIGVRQWELGSLGLVCVYASLFVQAARCLFVSPCVCRVQTCQGPRCHSVRKREHTMTRPTLQQGIASHK